jgi:adenosine 3'-phospho 5'-phosphosulfate transporter B3
VVSLFKVNYRKQPPENEFVVFLLEKTFNRYDVAAAICMSIGLIFFTLADSKVRPNFNSYGRFDREFYRNKHNYSLGVIIICSALIADAIIGNYQEKIMKLHHVSNVEIVQKKKHLYF